MPCSAEHFASIGPPSQRDVHTSSCTIVSASQCLGFDGHIDFPLIIRPWAVTVSSRRPILIIRDYVGPRHPYLSYSEQPSGSCSIPSQVSLLVGPLQFSFAV